MTSATPKARSQPTRSAILRAGEGIFADKGFDAARLEDVANEVGIRRASIVYYFKDKRDLYESVLAEVFGGLLERLQQALDPSADPVESIEAAVAAWVDYLIERPALPRILLREIASASSETRPALTGQIPPFVQLVDQFMTANGAALAGEDYSQLEAAHVASAIGGATIFFNLVIPALVPAMRAEFSRADFIDEHKAQVLRITRLLLEFGSKTDAVGRVSERSKGNEDE